MPETKENLHIEMPGVILGKGEHFLRYCVCKVDNYPEEKFINLMIGDLKPGHNLKPGDTLESQDQVLREPRFQVILTPEYAKVLMEKLAVMVDLVEKAENEPSTDKPQ